MNVIVIFDGKKELMNYNDAVELSQEKNLDLIQVSKDGQDPKVYKIDDLGKINYQKQKSEKNKPKPKPQKQIKITVNTDDNDLKIKANHSVEMINAGHAVKLTLEMKGRQLSHKEIGFSQVRKFLSYIKCECIIGETVSTGKNIDTLISPKKK